MFLRAGKLDFTEDDAWGKTRSDDFLARNPAHLTPMIESRRAAQGRGVGELRDHAVSRATSTTCTASITRRLELRAMVDSAMFYIIGTLYPYVARATYPALGFPQYAGEVGASEADANAKGAAQKAAMAAVAEPLEVFHKFYMDGKPFIGGQEPSIADIRLAATLEFLAVVDYPLPSWAKTFMSAIEHKLGAAYSEPAGDVRGYIAHMKSQKK